MGLSHVCKSRTNTDSCHIVMRLRSEGKRLPTKIDALRRALPALRLSLPPRYLNPARNILSGESCINHHIRLTNIILLQMVHLLVAISAKYDWNEKEFMRCWLETLEPCQNIVLVVEHWDNQHSPRIDPAIVSGLNVCKFAFRTMPGPGVSRPFHTTRSFCGTIITNVWYYSA